MKTGILCVVLLAVPLGSAELLAQPPSLNSLWPNADGLSWHYDQFYRTDFVVEENQVRLAFEGTTIAPSGIDAQILTEEVIGGALPTSALPVAIPDAFLRTLWQARPDLREKVSALAAAAPCPAGPRPPGAHSLLLGGTLAYRQTPLEIAAWRCNVADTRSWQWLGSNTSVGGNFTLQLIPELASDVFLHGTVAAVEDVTVPAGTYVNSLRVDYVIDYGTSTCTSPEGNPLGTFRAETRGFVYYAPNVGPVQSYEEFIPYVEATGECAQPGQIGQVASRLSLDLSSAPVPVQPVTWGQVKAAYR